MFAQKRPLRIHYLQHVPFEGPGFIESWALARGHRLTATRMYVAHRLPATEELDWLFILGGPMNVYEESRYPWLAREKRFIGEALREGKVLIGICLGAQLLACVLGAKVTRNPCVEIGWYPVEKASQALQSTLSGFLPDSFLAFHWHGDTFEIPRGAVHLARSQACETQAFAFGDRVAAFQEKPAGDGSWINGGFFVCEPAVLDRIAGDDTVFEKEPLEGLARDGQLVAYRHAGFWQPMDTLRDKNLLESLWQSGKAPWKCWE